MQELLNNPPTAGHADQRFRGRNWQEIAVGELVEPGDLQFVELDTGVEEATNVGLYTSGSLTYKGLTFLAAGGVRGPRLARSSEQEREIGRCDL